MARKKRKSNIAHYVHVAGEKGSRKPHTQLILAHLQDGE